MEEQEFIKTSDISLASSLLAVGFTIRAVDNHERIATFYFDKTEAVEQSISDYWARTMMVTPIDLFSARKQLMTRIKNE